MMERYNVHRFNAEALRVVNQVLPGKQSPEDAADQYVPLGYRIIQNFGRPGEETEDLHEIDLIYPYGLGHKVHPYIQLAQDLALAVALEMRALFFRNYKIARKAYYNVTIPTPLITGNAVRYVISYYTESGNPRTITVSARFTRQPEQELEFTKDYIPVDMQAKTDESERKIYSLQSVYYTDIRFNSPLVVEPIKFQHRNAEVFIGKEFPQRLVVHAKTFDETVKAVAGYHFAEVIRRG